MSQNLAAANIQFCDEYEKLFHKCLEAPSQWNQLRSFNDPRRSAGMPSTRELRRAQRKYSATFIELRAHARRCIVCEEMLQARVNGGPGAASYRVI